MTLTVEQTLQILNDKTDVRPKLVRAFYEYNPKRGEYKITFWADWRLPILTYTKGSEKILATNLAITQNGETMRKVLVELGNEYKSMTYIWRANT